jgi:glycolate oxidase FAD binding subunit
MVDISEADISELDIESELLQQVGVVAANAGEVEIVGAGSKRFYGEPVEALPIEVSAHSGVIEYDPAELVISLRAGCNLHEVEALLAQNGQMFGFEPPNFGQQATIGGMIASGLAGPRRAFAGSVRDFVLGVKMVNGRGELQQFGGKVIKNVAGFDVSRLMVGSLGTLGLILEASIKVIPVSEFEQTLSFEHDDPGEHIRWINELCGKPYPITASIWVDGESQLRLSGSEQGVREAVSQLGGEAIDFDWQAIREQQHKFFGTQNALSRVSLPPTVPDIGVSCSQMIEWGGAERWLSGEVGIDALREQVTDLGGSVCAYRNHSAGVSVFNPLPAAMIKLQRQIKSSFDPYGIFNRGRIYAGL